jgi:hypothetical protein
MPASGPSGLRALVSAVVLLLATVLGVECASAQVTAESLRPAATAAAYTAVPHEHSGTAEDDCKPRHGPRRSAGVQAPTRTPARVCGCDVRTGSAHCHAESVTVRERAPRACSVGLPVLHQTFRC